MSVKKASALITPFRFDLMIKYLYAKSIVKGYKLDFFKEAYKKHIYLWNGFREFDNKIKCTFEDFNQDFHNIIKSINENGFDSNISKIPMIDDTYMVNGAHRVAACLALDKELETREANMPHDGQKDCSWNSLFRVIGLPEKYANVAAVEYAKLKSNTYVVTLFPCAKSDYRTTIDIIEKYGRLVYFRKLELINHGPLNLMRELYVGEVWAGGPHDNYHGFRIKEGLCYTEEHPTWVFLAEFPNFEITRSVKNDIRKKHGLGNHSVHINDTHEQTLRLARLLFNENSIHHLNSTKPVNFSKFESHVKRFKKYLEDNNLDIDEYAISGSSPLSIYGLREGEDLDYIHFNNQKIEDPENFIHSHNEYGKDLYQPNYDEIIFNPTNHFYSMGIKFVSLPVIRNMKLKRNEPKDLADIKLIDTLI